MDLGVVAIVALIAGLAGGAAAAALVGTVEGMIRQRQGWTATSGTWQGRGMIISAADTSAYSRPAPTVSTARSPFDAMNDRAKRTVALAQDEAIRLNHDYIGTEHLLLGLIREGDGVAARTFASLGVPLSNARAAVEDLFKRGTRTEPPSEIVLAAATKAAIENARQEAQRLGHSHIGTEHLMLGLLPEGGAVAVLQKLGLEPDAVRDQLIATLGQPAPERRRESQQQGSFERLDREAAMVIEFAREEAQRSGHDYIGTEHLALALRRCGSGKLTRIWAELPVDSVMLRQKIEEAVPPSPGRVPRSFSMTPRMTKVIGMAQAIAIERGRVEASPDLLLLALADEGGGVGAQMLAQLGATAARIREIVDRRQA